MHARFPRISAPIVALLLVAACQGSTSPAPSPAASVPASVAAPSVAASPSAAASPSEAAPSAGGSASGSFALPSGFNGAPDLEAQLPSKVGDVTLQKFSFTGAGIAAGGGDDTKDLEAALGLLGKSLSDVSFAVAGADKVTVGAYRINGIDAGRLLDVINQAAAQSGEAIDLSDTNKGGKSVKKGTESGGDTIYFYPHGDILYFVTGDDDALVTQALQELP
ncbi:MAG TPA: hypothetical protein VGK63_02695 [Candidatus Limnocylindrales bacterium]